MVQGLAEDDQVHALRFDRGIFQFAQTKLQVLQAVLLRLGRAESDDLFRVIDGDDFFAATREQFAQEPFTRAEIRDDQRRQNSQQQVAECLPRTARPIHAVEAPGDVVEISLRLLVAAGEDAFEIEPIGGVFTRFLRAAHGQVDEFTRHRVGILAPFVERPLTLAPRLEQTRFLEQPQMRRDARLPHPRYFL